MMSSQRATLLRVTVLLLRHLKAPLSKMKSLMMTKANKVSSNIPTKLMKKHMRLSLAVITPKSLNLVAHLCKAKNN